MKATGNPLVLGLLALALAGCDFELDLFGPGSFGGGYGGSGGGGSYGPMPDPELLVTGEISVDGYPVTWGEAVVSVYAPEDTLTPLPVNVAMDVNGSWTTRTVTEAPVRWGSYELNFGSPADDAVCSYLARVTLWNGTQTELVPLVASSATPCGDGILYVQGAAFELPGYGEGEEHWVEGTVFVDDVLTDVGGAGVELFVRRRNGEPQSTFVTTQDDGAYRLDLDGPQWFELCSSGIGARFRAGDYDETVDLRGVDDVEACAAHRRLPDVRLGQPLAAEGVVILDGQAVGEDAGWVRMLDPADSTLVGDTVWTQDTGDYRLYFPFGMEEPGCGWLLEAGAEGAVPEIRSYQRFDYCDPGPTWHLFELVSG